MTEGPKLMATRLPDAFTPDIDDFRKAFAYNPVTGSLTWRVHRRPRIRPGDDAGTVLPDGHIAVTYKGRRYMGHHIAWAMHHGEWPGDRVVFKAMRDLRDPKNAPGKYEAKRRAARSNLRIDGLELQIDVIAESPAALAALERRERRAEEGNPVYTKRRVASSDPRVYYATYARAWRFSVKPAGNIAERVLADCSTPEEALAVAAEYDANIAMIEATPVVIDLPYRTPGLPSGMLQDLATWLAYDPLTGRMAWREVVESARTVNAHSYDRQELAEMKANGQAPETMLMHSVFILGGLNAVTVPKVSGVPFIRFRRRRLSAARVAWAFVHGEYPPRRGLRFRNGDSTDLRISNLERTTTGDQDD